MSEIIDDPHVLHERLAEYIGEWADRTHEGAFFLGIDGLPGTGKSTLASQIEPLIREVRSDIAPFRVSVDDFIATDRGSSKRQQMIETPDSEIFWRLFYTREALEQTLGTISGMDGESIRIEVERKYDRPSGQVKPGVIEVPPGRKVVIVEGVRSIDALRAAPINGTDPRLGIMMSAEPNVSLAQSIERDVAAGRRTAEEALRYRTAEYRHMMPTLSRSIEHADIVYTI